MKPRPRIKFLQLPHSVAERIESLNNRTAAALLSLLCRKTIGFGQGSVALSYQQIAHILKVEPRTIARAAKLLESSGDILRDRAAGGIYQWKLLLNKDEILADPNQTYSTREGVMIDRSAPSRHPDPHPHDIQIMTPPQNPEHPNQGLVGSPPSQNEHSLEPLKILIKDKDLKKQHPRCTTGAPQSNQSCVTGAPAVHLPQPTLSPHPEPSQVQPAVPQGHSLRSVCKTTDDEPLHKLCLKGLRQHGVSQRIARKLCNTHDHNLILSVLKTAPQRPGVQNLAAYIVSEIQDGGYEAAPQAQTGHQTSSGDRSTNQRHYKGSPRHKTSTSQSPLNPVTYRSVQQTKTEQQALEAQKQQQEQSYKNQTRQLAGRFKALSEDLQLRLKLIASVHLSQLIPSSGKKEEILRDKTFQRIANRTVLERFFEWIDSGLDETQALQQLESPTAA